MTVAKKKTVKQLNSGLSAIDERFVHEYLKHNCNARKAYSAIYPKTKTSTAETMGPKIFRKTQVKAAIEAELCKIWKEKDFESAKGNLYRRLIVIADASIDEVVNIEDGVLTVKNIEDIPAEVLPAIQSINFSESQTETGSSRRISVKLRDSLKAIETMAKIIKIIDPKQDAQQIEIILRPAVRPDQSIVYEDETNESI